MQYIVICKDQNVFATDWYSYENCWNDRLYCVVDTLGDKVTFDGQTWILPEYDHL